MTIPYYIKKLIIDITIDKVKKIVAGFKEEIVGNTSSKIISYIKDSNNSNVLIFIHGFTGSPTETFLNIPELLINEKKFAGYDIFSVGYTSSVLPDITAGIWSKKPDIENLADYFNTILKTHFNKYESIAIVAHSMGGLVAQSAIIKLDDKNLNRLNHFIMFGTPSKGLKKISFFKKWFSNKQMLDMKSDGEFIKSLRTQWQKKFKNSYGFEFEAVAGTEDDFIEKESSILLFKERHRSIINGNHSTMVKAENDTDTENQCFRLILHRLTPLAINGIEGNPFELVKFETKNNQIINNYQNNINQRDANALKELALAYDGLSKEDKAIKVIEAHPLLKTDTDIMGILAGRYKRKYLFSGNFVSNAKEAMKYYNKALEISKNLKNKKQIYYHAINMAFMSLVYKKDQKSMEDFAQLALDNCDINSNNIWEIATIAEANLYLKNDEESEKYYNKVIEQTKDCIRERSSIYINAKFAHQKLYKA